MFSPGLLTPIYIRSFLASAEAAFASLKKLPSWGTWLRCFDAVQMNAEEFELLGRAMGDPWELAAKIVGPELKLIAVTLGPGGARYVAGAAFRSDPLQWPDTRHRVATPGPARSGIAPAEGPEVVGDPTGCGDVWGATFLARLLGGDQLQSAMIQANRIAAKNVGHRGASGLNRHLRGRLSTQRDVKGPRLSRLPRFQTTTSLHPTRGSLPSTSSGVASAFPRRSGYVS